MQRGLAWLTPIVAQLLEDRGSNLQWLEAHLGSGLLRGCSGRPEKNETKEEGRKFLLRHCGNKETVAKCEPCC